MVSRVGVLVPVAIGAQVASSPVMSSTIATLPLTSSFKAVLPARSALGGRRGIIDHRQRAPGERHGIELAVLADRIDIEEFREDVADARHLALVDRLDRSAAIRIGTWP